MIFKKPYIGKIQKKIFGAKLKFIDFYILGKSRKRFVRIKIESESGERLVSFKIPRDEYRLILLAATSINESFEEFLMKSIREYVDSRYEIPID